MNWYVADKEYINYLTKYDSRVGYVEYGGHLKLHLGIVLELESAKYYVPISSYKSKYDKMSNSLDFHKIKDEETGFVYAVLNLNNMIPIPDECVIQLKYNEVEKFRSFVNEKEKTNYIYLLQKEKKIIDNLESVLTEKARKLYHKSQENPDGKLSQRCCNFTLLEEKSKEYKKNEEQKNNRN